MSEQPIIQAMLERCPNAVRTDTMSYDDWLERKYYESLYSLKRST